MEWLMLCVCDFYSNVKQHWILRGEKTMMNWSCCWQTSRYEQKAVFTVFPEKNCHFNFKIYYWDGLFDHRQWIF